MASKEACKIHLAIYWLSNEVKFKVHLVLLSAFAHLIGGFWGLLLKKPIGVFISDKIRQVICYMDFPTDRTVYTITFNNIPVVEHCLGWQVMQSVKTLKTIIKT